MRAPTFASDSAVLIVADMEMLQPVRPKPSLLRRLARFFVGGDDLPSYRLRVEAPIENFIDPGTLYRLLRPQRWQAA